MNRTPKKLCNKLWHHINIKINTKSIELHHISIESSNRLVKIPEKEVIGWQQKVKI